MASTIRIGMTNVVSILFGLVALVSGYTHPVFSVIDIPTRVLPASGFEASITVLNSGVAAWTDVTVIITPPGGDPQILGPFDITASMDQEFSANFAGHAAIGRYYYGIELRVGMESRVNITVPLEVTCSDGVYCNGIERYSGGSCVNGPNPCDDGQECTVDTCQEIAQICHHAPTGAGCADCTIIGGCEVEANCTGKVCGDDGCGLSCGTCAVGTACDGSGQCVVADHPGSCGNPLELFPNGFTEGVKTVYMDTVNGLNEVVPTCNDASTAPEIVWTFTIPEEFPNVGLEARTGPSEGGVYHDTVMELRKGGCADPVGTVACSDDSTPPGDFLSRISLLLSPGTYYLFVDGYDFTQLGPVGLQVKFVNDCIPVCDGTFCGSDFCGGSCGECGNEEACNPLGRCIPDPCIADCVGKECGDDGCGQDCADTCPGTADPFCVYEDAVCTNVPECNHDVPQCVPDCGAEEFCGSDCQCYNVTSALPDVIVDPEALETQVLFETRYFPESSCAYFERCVFEPGVRRIMKFTVVSLNQGFAEFYLPPAKERPDIFEYSPCHQHYHYRGYATYNLLDPLTGDTIVPGTKQGFCLLDTHRYRDGPAIACEPQTDCSEQGISPGWGDVYGNSLDCQWVDITGVEAGEYHLKVELNPSRSLIESNYENNVAIVPVTIPPEDGATSEPTYSTQSSVIVDDDDDTTPDNGIQQLSAITTLLLVALAICL